jgi:hypothetical protein
MKKTRNGSRQASAGSKQKSLLPEPDYNPIWPMKGTYLDIALSLMLRGKEITSIDFEDVTESQRLSAYIEKLYNKYGWPVLREDVIVRFEKKPKKRSVRKYYLDKAFISTIKKISGGVS